ncbi:MAG: hypothetical protein AB8I08_32850 [Sandaracinaceae bacterium]
MSVRPHRPALRPAAALSGTAAGARALCGCIAVLVVWTVLAEASTTAAQDGPARLAPTTPLTLRPTPATRALTRGVARTLGLRLPVAVGVGDDAPPEILEAVPPGHLGIGRDEDRVLLVLAGPEAQVYRSEVEVDTVGADAVRSVALAIEVLRDAALEGPPAGSEPRRTQTYTRAGGQSVTYTYLAPEGGLFGPPPDTGALATPMISLAGMVGLSTERLTAIVGPRVVLGLCLGIACVSLEGDLPVLPDESQACDGRRIEYRPVNLGMRATLRPFDEDGFSAGIVFGLLTRFGVANLIGVDASRVVSDFGIRGGLEGGVRVSDDFEVFAELGADIHTHPGAFVRAPRPGGPMPCDVAVERILVEDFVTVWGALGIRLRPR